MSEYKWQRFTSTGSKLGNYSISINNSLSFGLLAGFYVKEEINKYKKAVLFYDKVKKAVAFSFTNDEKAEGAFAVTHGTNNGSISARSFFLTNEIKQDKFMGKKTPRKVKDDNLGTIFIIGLLESE